MNRLSLAVAFFGTLAASSVCSAQEALNVGFEAPQYTVGNITGQQGWLTLSGGSAGSVSTDRAHSGARSLRISTAQIVEPAAWWYKPVNVNGAGHAVDVEWSMYLVSPEPLFASSFGIDIYNPQTDRVLAVWVDGTGGNELVYGTGIGTGYFVPFGQWHNYKARLDYVNSSYHVYYDGTEVGSGTLSASLGTTITDADVWMIDPGADTGYFDDIKITVVTGGGTCPADINGDGGVTIDDLLLFLEYFYAGDIRADVDDGSGTGTHDGGVTIDDLLFFLVHLDLGC